MATQFDLVLDQGATFQTTINLVDAANNPMNLAGYTAQSQMKKWYTSSTSFTFAVAVNATSGAVTLSMPANTTSTIASGRYVYDIDVFDPANNVTRIVEGIVVVTPGVTDSSIETTANTYVANDFITIPLIG